MDPERSAIFGPAVIAAYEVEQRQDWMGAIIDPSCDHLLAANFLRSDALAVRYYAPMKQGDRRKYICVDWRDGVPNRDAVREAFVRPEDRHESFRKLENTLRFYDWRYEHG